MFINITRATIEVPGQTPSTFMEKGVGFKSGKYYMSYINKTHYPHPSETKVGGNLTAILPNTT